MKCKKTLSTLIFIGLCVQNSQASLQGMAQFGIITEGDRASTQVSMSSSAVAASSVSSVQRKSCSDKSHGNTVSNNLLKYLTAGKGPQFSSGDRGSNSYDVFLDDLITSCAKFKVSAVPLGSNRVVRFEYDEEAVYKDNPAQKNRDFAVTENIKSFFSNPDMSLTAKPETGEEKIMWCLVNNGYLKKKDGRWSLDFTNNKMIKESVRESLPMGRYDKTKSSEVLVAAPSKSAFKAEPKFIKDIDFEIEGQEEEWRCLQAEELPQVTFAYETGLDQAYREAAAACNSSSPAVILEKMKDFSDENYYGNLGLVKEQADKIVDFLIDGYKEESLREIEKRAHAQIKELEKDGKDEELLSDIQDLMNEIMNADPSDAKGIKKLVSKLEKKVSEYETKYLDRYYNTMLKIAEYNQKFGEDMSEEDHERLSKISEELANLATDFNDIGLRDFWDSFALVKNRNKAGKKLMRVAAKSKSIHDLDITESPGMTASEAREEVKDSKNKWTSLNKSLDRSNRVFYTGDTSYLTSLSQAKTSAYQSAYKIKSSFQKDEYAKYQEYCVGNMLKFQWPNQYRCKMHMDPNNQKMREKMMMSKYNSALYPVARYTKEMGVLEHYLTLGERYRIAQREPGSQGGPQGNAGLVDPYGLSFMNPTSTELERYNLGGMGYSQQLGINPYNY